MVSKRRITVGAIGLALGGLAPLITGLLGMLDYVEQGHIVTKNGDMLTGRSAIISSALFIVAGFGMIAYAIWQYRRHTKISGKSDNQKVATPGK